MPRREQLQAIILRSFDVGDADRFCILLTREHGRMAARAKGVRKTGSRMGGCLLPFHQVTVDLTETSAGFLVTGATLIHDFAAAADMQTFTRAHECAELLILLLQDEDPLPEIFDALEVFLREHLPVSSAAMPAFTINILALLGFLPDTDALDAFGTCGQNEHAFIRAAMEGECPTADADTLKHVHQIIDALLAEHITTPLKAQTLSEICTA